MRIWSWPTGLLPTQTSSLVLPRSIRSTPPGNGISGLVWRTWNLPPCGWPPQYHDYALDAAEAVALARLAAEAHLPLLIPHRLVDVRQHHWMDVGRIIGMNEP